MSCCFLLCLRPLETVPGALPACPREEPTSTGEAVQPDGELGCSGRNMSSSPGAELVVCDMKQKKMLMRYLRLGQGLAGQW